MDGRGAWRAGLAAGAAAAALCAGGGAAAAPAEADLSGYWRLVGQTAPPPALTAAGRRGMRAARTDGETDVEASRWCVPQGVPYVMTGAGALEIRRAAHEVLIVAERLAIPRHIYLQRRTHVGADVFDNTPVGDSLGRWEGAALVVDTAGFSPGVGPAGAPRTDRARLTERFVRRPDGRLQVTATWRDPGTFARPYTMTTVYERLPDSYAPADLYCDPRENGVGHR